MKYSIALLTGFLHFIVRSYVLFICCDMFIGPASREKNTHLLKMFLLLRAKVLLIYNHKGQLYVAGTRFSTRHTDNGSWSELTTICYTREERGNTLLGQFCVLEKLRSQDSCFLGVLSQLLRVLTGLHSWTVFWQRSLTYLLSLLPG